MYNMVVVPWGLARAKTSTRVIVKVCIRVYIRMCM